MGLAQPFIELWHERRGTVSASQRALVEELRRDGPPRSPEIALAVARLHAPWWGFAAYGVVYAMTVMAIVAALASGAIEAVVVWFAPSIAAEWSVMFWIAAVLTAPLSSWPFRRWVRRRRRELVDVTRVGAVTPAEIVAASVVTVSGGLSLKGTAHSTHLTIASADGSTFKGHVAGEPSWVATGAAVEMLVLPAAQYAVLLCPDGASRPLRRERSERRPDGEADAGLVRARVVR